MFVNNRVKGPLRDILVHTYTLLVGLVSVAIFLYGFFPIKYDDNGIAAGINDIPDRVEGVRIRRDKLYGPVAEKIIFMVIDALRWDFVIGPVGTLSMPITNSLINKGSTCLMQAKCDPPTVTMPRIKAMMTGAVPNFIDVALNFGNLPISGDNLLLQAKNQGHRINFYGDDTWLKIFPGMFDRAEGTTSFYVNDFSEVDDNVTRHLTKEFERKDDWSLLFLHYLGLDHIGHVAGPFSPLIEPKLREMDKIIGRINDQVENWNENGLPAILVVCGDHGMKNSGGHGGSTEEETLVPFLIIGGDAVASCLSKKSKPNRMRQVDVAPILSMLLGTPIPSSNIGSVPLCMLNHRSDSSKLFVLYNNARQIINNFNKLPNYESSEAYRYYEDAIEMHIRWLMDGKDNSTVDTVLDLYERAFNSMKELLIRSRIDYNIHAMSMAIIFIVHIVRAMIVCQGSYVSAGRRIMIFYWIIASIISYFGLRYLWEAEIVVSAINFKTFSFNVIAIGIVAPIGYLAGDTRVSLLSFRNWNFYILEWSLIVGTIAHTMSLTSSSFVEEEHQTWYFFWTTLLISFFIDVMRKRFDVRLSLKLTLCLVAHRIFRKFNSTGNKYAHHPDIANWLRLDENRTAMTCLLLTALGLLILIAHKCEEKEYKNKTLILHVAAAICIYLRHMASANVAKLPFYVASRGIIEVRIFWIILLMYSLLWTHRLARRRNGKIFATSLLRYIVQMWTIISAILHRPQNVILLPMQIFVSSAINDFLTTCDAPVDVYVYMWMGNVFYFYQGNSNSLSTIDVAAGYVGMESYRPLLTGLFLLINTYAAPVLAYLILLYRNIHRTMSNSCSESTLPLNKKYTLWRFLPLAVYTIIITIQRYHLFIWTVFSPKLLYEAMYCAVMFTIIMTMQIAMYCATRQ